MKLSAPKNATWFVSLALGLLGTLHHYDVVSIGPLAPYAFLLVVVGWALLLVASLVRGM